MKRILRRIVSFALITMFLIIPCSEVSAAENLQIIEDVEELNAFYIDVDNLEHIPDISFFVTTITNASIMISYDSSGMLVEFYVSTNKQASVIGVKDIVIEKKGLFGIWTTVGTSSGKEASDRSSMGCGVRYSDAKLGQTYRVSCTFYGDVDGYHEISGTSDESVYTY